MADKRSFNVVVLVGGDSGDYPGSVPKVCRRCGARIWLAPASQRAVATAPDILLLCLPCGEAMALAADEVTYGALPETLQEVESWRKRN